MHKTDFNDLYLNSEINNVRNSIFSNLELIFSNFDEETFMSNELKNIYEYIFYFNKKENHKFKINSIRLIINKLQDSIYISNIIEQIIADIKSFKIIIEFNTLIRYFISSGDKNLILFTMNYIIPILYDKNFINEYINNINLNFNYNCRKFNYYFNINEIIYILREYNNLIFNKTNIKINDMLNKISNNYY